MSQNCFHALLWLCSVVHCFAWLCSVVHCFARLCIDLFFFAPTDERYEALYASDVTGLYAGYAQAMQHCTQQMMPQKTKMQLRSQAVQHWQDCRWHAIA